MADTNIDEAFTALHPLCELLTKKPDVRVAKTLSEVVRQRSTGEIQYFLDYILLPIDAYLSRDSKQIKEEERQQLVELLRTVLSRAKIRNVKYFVKLYTTLLIQIYDPNEPDMLIASYEELKESTIKCLDVLVKSSTADVIESLYVREHAARLSQGVHTCLTIAKTEKLQSLRLCAMETLMSLFQVHDKVDPNDIVLRGQVADTVMFFLPGVAHGLHQVALGNDLQNHKVTVMAIRAFGRIVALIMEDQSEVNDFTIESVLQKQSINESDDPLGNLLKLDGEKGMKKYLETAMRSEKWLHTASSKLNGLMRSLINLVRHSHCQVRKELLVAVQLLLSKCSRNMTNNFMELIEILISLSEDGDEEIRNLSRKTLDDINEKFSRNHGMRPVVELLEENVYKLLTKLPRLMRRSEDSVQLTHLNQLAGYIKLLGKQRLPHVMASVSHLRRLLLALVYVAELDCSHVPILHDILAKDVENITYNTVHTWKRFKFIRDSTTADKLISVCKLLGELGDLELLINCILDLTCEIPQYRKELILILNSVSIVQANDSAKLHLYKQIIENYTDPANWYLPIEVVDDVTLGDAQSNIVNCCLLIEGLGNMAINMQREYENFLLKTLYLIIERAGSGNTFISQAGMHGLEQITRSQNHRSIADLLRENVDYVSYHVTMKMRRVERNPGVLDVFAVIMRYSTMDVLPCLRGVVDDALAQLSVNRPDKNVQSLLKVLYVFTICVRKLTRENVESRGTSATTNERRIEKKAEIVVRAILEHWEAKKASENIEEDVIVNPEDIEKELLHGNADQFSAYDNQEEEKKLEPPSYVKMTEDVMKCSLHFLPSKDLPKSLLAMQILEEGLNILSEWSEQLLPLVHQIWHPLVDRFHDSNILAINRAWGLLHTLADVSQDFIRSRTLKQVFPSLATFLTKAAKESYKKDAKNAYKYTQMYKLQRTLLSQAGVLAKNLKLQERQLWQILDISQPYLNSQQHPVLQEYCVQLYKDVAMCNADIVWVKCLGIWNRHVASIPDGHKLALVDLKMLSTNASDYRKNIETILTWIEEMTVDL